MSQLILPDRVRIQLDFEAQLEQLGDRHGWLKHFDAELRAIDSHLSLVKASDAANQTGLVPGHWHIKRDNPTTIPTFIALRNDDGGFIEPNSSHLELIRKNDMQRAGAFEAFKQKQDNFEVERERAKAAQTDERQSEMAERIEQLEHAQVSMKKGWTNSVKGRKA